MTKTRSYNGLAKFMEAKQENTAEFVEFFERHGQYWKRSVFLDLLDFYYETADFMADKIVSGLEPGKADD